MIDSPKNLKEWGKFIIKVWKSGMGGKAALLVVGLGILIWGGLLPKKLADANGTIAEREREISGLRFQNQNLIATNLAMQQMVDPIRRIYPDLPLAAAIAHVMQDVDEIRTKANQGTFKPFDEMLKSQFIEKVQLFQARWPALTNIQINIDTSTRNRELVAMEVDALLKKANSPIKLKGGMHVRSPRTVVSFQPEFKNSLNDFGECIATIIRPPLNANLISLRTNKFGKIIPNQPQLELFIHGDIGFETNGLILQ